MLKRLVVLAGVVCAVLATTASGPSGAPRGMVIGNSAYKHAATLRNPGNDANDVAEILKKIGFDGHLGLDLDQQGFARTIEQFARSLDDADVGLFFYAGHWPADERKELSGLREHHDDRAEDHPRQSRWLERAARK